ncbi:T-complex protein 1 zeta subunit [Fragilariopsis cylindrus CCMP1102]|uniref:T-complex protein 1 zeta subunit n=1 Tax=Fragilariopsis cylindrus CCMP1102 TaxID=635003 RepID=A0A1E7FPD4_9STRA|nr:T-complex protein 1 zeta subunit [Fragilariopsis cylindrus CCMP1102]|eukprot:OEU20019.1 T-complex protein 1 zeta subunit [Fragilariopsis cylindrus CCMP1102]
MLDANPNAEIVSKTQARAVNVAAGVGLLNVLKSNLGPRGTLKLLVGGAGQLKLTKDGLVLLKEMQIQHPTAILIARTATAQDDITGDGTTSTVLLCGELLRQADRHISEGVHPRILVEGLEKAREEALKYLNEIKTTFPADGEGESMIDNRDLLTSIALTSLATKLDYDSSLSLSESLVSAVQCIYAGADSPIDLSRIEVMPMSRSTNDSRFINGIVLDHGARHPDMPDVLHNCKIMTLNCTLEYEKTETQSGFYYSSAEEREKLVESERKWLDERCKQIIDFKRSVCKDGESFVIINQKGVDPLSLDIFAKEGILCLRRAKRRNMERLTLACGGSPIHSLQDIEESQLGYAGKVSQVTLGEDKFTFVEDCKSAKSCTMLLQGPNEHSLNQAKDAIKDGLRALKNALEDNAVVSGAGAFEVATAMHLQMNVLPTVKGKQKLGIQAFCDALLIIPKTLADNSGLDVQDTLLKLQDEHVASKMLVGLDVKTGEAILPSDEGIWDNVRVKRQSLYLSTVLASQLLLVDEVMRAGKQMGVKPPMDE